MLQTSLWNSQGCHGTEKTGNWDVHFCSQGKYRELTMSIKNVLHGEFCVAEDDLSGLG